MAQATPDNHRYYRILLVEGEPRWAVLVRTKLFGEGRLSFGLELEWADDVEEALRRLSSEKVDAVLLDYTVMSGECFVLLERLRAISSTLPVVVASSDDNPKIEEELMRRGVSDYFVKGNAEAKPLAAALRFAIERHLGRSDSGMTD
ncbi:MAG: hypothetical protein MOGMAGMI_00465 [Candidatus Omnitrophica bacterium]|nr:hypothetical protein [Candidatus Omnitrophota bacterium]